MTQQNPYLELVKSDVATEVQSSMQSAADKNPDTEAKLLALAKAANVPIDTARLDTQAVQRQVDLSLDYKALAERYPSTAQLLTDPNNAALAKDDLPAVSRLEDTLNFGVNMFRSAGASVTATSEGLYGVAQAGAETAGSIIDPIVGTILPQNPFNVMADKIRNWRQIAKSDTKAIEGDQAGMGFVQKSALSGAKSLGQSLLLAPAALMTGQPGLLLYPMAAQTGGQAFGEARDKGIPLTGSLAFGTSQAMIEFATERIPAIALLRDVGLQSSFKKMLVNQVVREVPGEQVATVFQDLNEWAVLHPDKPFSVYLAERPSAAAQTLIATIVATGGQAGIGAAASRVANGPRQQQTVEMLTALKDGLMDSKTFERSPQRVRDFIAAHTKDGPLENVFIPAEQLTKYFQDMAIDPAIAAAEMGATNYAEAFSAGTDVVIPLADFLKNVAKTPHYDALLPDIRFVQGEMTSRELDLYEKNHPDEVRRMVEDAKNFQLPAESPVITQITDDITGQLVAGGMERGTADSYATLYAKTIGNLAERAGMEPLALHEKYGLQVIRPMADVLTKLNNSDIQIDPLLDRLRSGDIPTDAVVNGPALMEFLRGIGGLKDGGGELRRMEVDIANAPFVKNLIQQIDGKSLDEAAALAQEAGYPVQDILEAIGQELQGKPVYSANNANEQLLGLQRDLNNLGEYLQSIGVDLASATNDQVRQAMAAAIGSVYEQSANTRDQFAFTDVWTDDAGMPIYYGKNFVLQAENEFDTGTDFEENGLPLGQSAFVGEGNRVFQFSIRDPETQGALGNVVLQTAPDGRIVALHDIVISLKNRGLGTTIVGAIAEQGTVQILQVIPSAQAFWDSVGIYGQDQYDNATLDFDSFRKSGRIRKGGVAGQGVQQQSAGTEAGSGGTSQTTAGKPGLGDKLYQSVAKTESGSAPYDKDIFGNPLPDQGAKRAKPAKNGDVHTVTAVPLATIDEASGTFAVNTAIVEDKRRELSTDKVETPEDAVRALGYLTAGAVERFDALITDADGKPLAIVGSFKGTVTQAAVYPATLAREAFRIDGAANIWMAHNHPSGKPDLSSNDRLLAEELAKSFAGSNIQMRALFAIASEGDNRLFNGTAPDGSEYAGEVEKPGDSKVSVPVVERVFIKQDKLARMISSPDDASQVVTDIAGDKPGLVLLDAQNTPRAFWPLSPDEAVQFRDNDGALDNAHRVFSKANPVSAIIANPDGAYSKEALTNIAGLLGTQDVRLLDVFSYDSADPARAQSAAERAGVPTSSGNFNQDKRGYIQFGKDRKFNIALLENADLSTFIHETGHFWLEVMGDLAADPAAGQQVKDDYAAILKFLKVESREQIGVEQHEMFARANEAYLREGKAPSPALRGMFQRFKAWLTMIYKSVEQLNVKLSDEVRGVFDRIYASDAEIEAAKDELDVSALLTSASEAGLSDVEFAAYQKSLEGEVARAKDELQARLMRQYQRERNKWWKDELAKIEADVTAEVDAQPDQNAFATLVKGALPDGTFIKLDKAELLEKYGKEYIKRLPRGKQAVYDSKGQGWALQDAAELLGFETGDDLVQAMVNLRPRKELIAAEAKARMVERHGDMLTDGTLHDEATEALHNEERANRLAFELKAIRRKQREVKPFVNAAMKQDKQQAQAATDVPPIQAFRDAARGIIGQQQVRDLSPYGYLLAERKASRKAFQAMASKDYQTAAIEKQRELLNHHLYLEATKARDEIDGIVSHMAKLGKTAARERIGKAGHDYLDQIDALLEQYQFQKVSLRQIDRRKSLMEWYQEQVDNGFEPVIDAELMANARSLNYKELPVDQVRAINDAVRSIEHLASLKNKLLTNRKGIEFDQAVDELAGIAEDSNGKINRPFDPEQRTAGEKTADWFAAKDRALVNVRTMVAWLDGGKPDGPWHTLLFNPAANAQTAQLDMMKSVGKPVNDLMEKYMEGAGERMLDKFTTPLGVVSRKYLMSIAFNMGSESSFDKMLRGGPGGRVEGGARVQWNEAAIHGMVANLDAKDWKFIQGIWTILDTRMYPQINDMTKRVSGVPLEKVDAKPFTITTRDGETLRMEGGYYPLKYDPQFSQAGLKQESGPLAGLTEVGYSSATTSRGHTKARIEGFAAPLLFDFTHILQSHLAGAIKDLTHREFLMDAQKILRNDRIRQVLQERIGTQYEGEFMSWLKRIANDGNQSPQMTFLDKFAEGARTNATIVALGYKVTTILAQAAGLFNAIEHPNVGAGWFYRGLSESIKHPVESYTTVVEKSGEMRHRFDTIDQTVREVLSKVQTTQYGKVKDGITRAAFIGINVADRMVTIPTWIAAYRKALASGIAEEEAIHAADDAVVGSQGAGAAKDINSIQAARGTTKLFTMFYTPFAAQYNRMRSIGRAAGQQGWKYTPEAAMRVMLLTFFPSVMADLLTSRGPSQCDASDVACYSKWLAVKMMSSQTATLPFIRDIGNGLEQYISGKQGNVKISPLIMALDKVHGAVVHSFESLFGDRQFDQKLAFDVFESSGYLLGLPTGQARITGEYLTDLAAGNDSPDSIGSFLHDLVFRREKK